MVRAFTNHFAHQYTFPLLGQILPGIITKAKPQAALSIISINVFTLGQQENKTIPLSAFNENKIYKTCGYLMLLFLVLTPICDIFNLFPNSTLIFEALMLFAFGISWLIKGRALGDKGEVGKMLYRETH